MKKLANKFVYWVGIVALACGLLCVVVGSTLGFLAYLAKADIESQVQHIVRYLSQAQQ